MQTLGAELAQHLAAGTGSTLLTLSRDPTCVHERARTLTHSHTQLLDLVWGIQQLAGPYTHSTYLRPTKAK